MNVELDERGMIRNCPSCGQRNRVAYARLNAQVRCGKCKGELPPVSEPLSVTDERQFESLIHDSALPLLVDFWAEWCGPCKMMAPEFARAAAANAGQFLALKVETEALPALAARYGIAAIPTLVLFSGGHEVGRAQGARSAQQIEVFVRQQVRTAWA